MEKIHFKTILLLLLITCGVSIKAQTLLKFHSVTNNGASDTSGKLVIVRNTDTTITPPTPLLEEYAVQ